MFLATVLTALATTQAAVAFNDNGPTRNLKGRQVASEQVAKPESMAQKTKTKPRKMLHSMHIPAESRIVGGNDAQQGDYPFFVQGNGCGGSLVWDDVVLTAAHCQGAFDDSVLVGPYIQSSTSGGAENIDVERQVPHPSYDSGSQANDFMLLKLGNRVANPNLTPIAVNSVGSNPAYNDVLTVIGFGALSEGGYGSSRLQEVNVNYLDYETCNELYNGDIVDSVMLCAGVPGGGKDSCQGDSGGPIFDQEGTQIGVVSWGIGCARENFPGVYSRVSGAKDWIDATICELSSSPPPSCGQTGGGTNTGDNEVVIEVKYDNYPAETGWTLRDSAGTLIAGQSTGSFSTQSGTVSKTAFVAEGAYTFELTDDFGDGICCLYGTGEFKITVNGEPLAVVSNGEFEDVTRETFNVVGRGEEPMWDVGALCALGTTCNQCQNEATYWWGKAFTACGNEPKTWTDGTRCALGTTCNVCQNSATYWPGLVFTACGSEPCWGEGTTCGSGTTCNTCCSGNSNNNCPWYWFGVCTCN